MVRMCQLKGIVLTKWTAFGNKAAQLHGRGARNKRQMYRGRTRKEVDI